MIVTAVLERVDATVFTGEVVRGGRDAMGYSAGVLSCSSRALWAPSPTVVGGVGACLFDHSSWQNWRLLLESLSSFSP